MLFVIEHDINSCSDLVLPALNTDVAVVMQ